MMYKIYPELYAVVGGAVPNYAGMFLRGLGGNSYGIGIQQPEGINANREFDMKIQGLHGVDDYGNLASGYSGPVLYKGGSGSVSFKVVLGGDSETRPVNKAVRYLIRAR